MALTFLGLCCRARLGLLFHPSRHDLQICALSCGSPSREARPRGCTSQPSPSALAVTRRSTLGSSPGKPRGVSCLGEGSWLLTAESRSVLRQKHRKTRVGSCASRVSAISADFLGSPALSPARGPSRSVGVCPCTCGHRVCLTGTSCGSLCGWS